MKSDFRHTGFAQSVTVTCTFCPFVLWGANRKALKPFLCVCMLDGVVEIMHFKLSETGHKPL